MTRPLRLEVPNGLYHVTARGNERKPIFRDIGDRQRFLEILGKTTKRYRWSVLGYCLMGNHYHALLRTPVPNLARGMRDLNGIYAQWFNRRHDRFGHLFSARYWSTLIQKEDHLLTAAAYIARNPVRAGLCATPRGWRWSSHRAILGEEAPGFLMLDELFYYFGAGLHAGRERYRELSEGAADPTFPPGHSVVGTDGFVRGHLSDVPRSPEFARRQTRLPRPSLEALLARPLRAAALAAAYDSGYTMPAIARELGLHPSTVSRRLARHRAQIKT